MAKGGYIGVDGIAKKIKKGYVSPDGTAKAVKKAYMGIGGVARPIWSSGGKGKLEYYGTLTPLGTGRGVYGHAKVGNRSLIVAGSINGNIYSSLVESFDENLVKETHSNLQYPRYLLKGANAGDYALFSLGAASPIDYATRVEVFDKELVQTTAQDINDREVNGSASSVGGNAVFMARDYGYSYDDLLTKRLISTTSLVYQAASYTKNYALFSGGSTGLLSVNLSNSVYAYDSSLTRISATPISDNVREHVGVNFLDGVIFALGRKNNTPESSSNYSTFCNFYSNDLVRTILPNLSDGRMNVFGSSSKNYVVFSGGTTDSNYSTGLPYTDAIDSDFVKVDIQNLQYARAYAPGFSIGNVMISAGGRNRSSYLNSVEAYVEV